MDESPYKLTLAERAILGENPGRTVPEIVDAACREFRTQAEAAEHLGISVPTLRLLRAKYGLGPFASLREPAVAA